MPSLFSNPYVPQGISHAFNTSLKWAEQQRQKKVQQQMAELWANQSSNTARDPNTVKLESMMIANGEDPGNFLKFDQKLAEYAQKKGIDLDVYGEKKNIDVGVHAAKQDITTGEMKEREQNKTEVKANADEKERERRSMTFARDAATFGMGIQQMLKRGGTNAVSGATELADVIRQAKDIFVNGGAKSPTEAMQKVAKEGRGAQSLQMRQQQMENTQEERAIDNQRADVREQRLSQPPIPPAQKAKDDTADKQLLARLFRVNPEALAVMFNPPKPEGKKYDDGSSDSPNASEMNAWAKTQAESGEAIDRLERMLPEMPDDMLVELAKRVTQIGGPIEDIVLQELKKRDLAKKRLQQDAEANDAHSQPKSKAEYDALPSGTTFIDPEGQTRVKP